MENRVLSAICPIRVSKNKKTKPETWVSDNIYLNASGFLFVCRDLKPSNIFLADSGNISIGGFSILRKNVVTNRRDRTQPRSQGNSGGNSIYI